ncbi:OB-fold putative lipoprotein [Cupriavidus basilensis]|uniref:OB-fold putative lipoprotein n=1 Tax=Cupriavidus basilensis TaxID=68895 RepID=UPI0020A6CD02|nr:OB-fold putative lipoprotein [Cupriavidus basilensis]MCP3020311.1 OB-fold putative lipoprotein [Cupriavidus basilensis]
MLNRTQQILIGVVALAVLGMLWLTGNHEEQQEEPAPEPVAAASAAVPEPNAGARGVPKNGTLDPISIDPNRSTDILPQYQADTLVDDYQENAGAANDRYLGKYFIVEGVASGVRREGNDTVFLDIRSNSPTLVVRAKLLPIQICGPAGRTCEVEARGTMVRRGQKVAVECTGAGQVEGSPILEDCLVRGGAN